MLICERHSPYTNVGYSIHTVLAVRITNHKDLDSILVRFVGYIHPEWTPTSKAKKLLVDGYNWTCYPGVTAVLDHPIEEVSDVCEFVFLHT